MPELQLAIELVPQPCWGSNLRKVIPRARWDTLRRQVYADYGHRCGICGAEGRLICHEQWDYNDQALVQSLRGFIALCDLCDHVKHIGLAGILASQGKLDMEPVIEHFMRVNGCDRSAFEQHKREAFAQWRERGAKHPWRTDMGEYGYLIEGVTTPL